MALGIAVHDYSGHPFQVQLSRELARRGHRVLHLHCPSYQSGKGALERTPDDPLELRIEGVSLDRAFEKYAPVRRLRQERDYGRRLARRIQAYRPDVLVSSNTPLFAQRVLMSACKGIPFVFWQQDLYSVAMKREAERRVPFLGRPLGDRFVELERQLLAESDAVVTISEDFRAELVRWGLPPEKLHVIENWAPVEELPERPRDNAWAREHGLVGDQVVLYSGTLGLKHDPELLVELARSLREDPGARVVVCSEGPSADVVARDAPENLLVLGFQPYERLPDVLGSADVLVALLDREAGRFAVPSKVLSYHCAGRPILAAVPAENLAAAIVRANGSGLVVDPGRPEALVDGARQLLADPELQQRLGAAARAYAERAFDIHAIADRFEQVVESVAEPAQVRSRPDEGVKV